MNFDLNQITGAANLPKDESDAPLNLPKAIAGAVGAAIALGLVYGVVGRFVAEFSYLAVLVGTASGLAAVRLGGKASPVAGAVAALASLVMIVAAKLIVGSPEGTSWLSYHLTMFDIIFCYIANPVAAFVAGGTGVGRGILKKLPF